MEVRRGDIVLVRLDPVQGSEQGKTRPAVVIQHDALNKHARTTIVVPITTTDYEREYPMHVRIQGRTIKVEHIRAIDKSRIVRRTGQVSNDVLTGIGRALQYVTDFY